MKSRPWLLWFGVCGDEWMCRICKEIRCGVVGGAVGVGGVGVLGGGLGGGCEDELCSCNAQSDEKNVFGLDGQFLEQQE
jgi:hypothetical protein